MTRLILICHAATAATRAARFPDDEAVDGGAIRPSRPPVAAGRWLAGPERRAVDTAVALAGAAPVATDRDLRDWDMGRWRGRGLAELHRCEPEAVAAWLGDAGAAPHGGESLRDLLARADRWLAGQAEAGGRAAAVTHPPVLRALLTRALGAGEATFRHIDAGPLCRARLSHDGRRWVLQGFVRPDPA